MKKMETMLRRMLAILLCIALAAQGNVALGADDVSPATEGEAAVIEAQDSEGPPTFEGEIGEDSPAIESDGTPLESSQDDVTIFDEEAMPEEDSAPEDDAAIEVQGDENISLKLGNTINIGPPSVGKSIISCTWTVSDNYAIQTVGSDNNGKTLSIKAVKMPQRNPVQIQCKYYYTELRGNYMYSNNGIYDYYITVINSGSSSSGSYTIRAPKSTYDIDWAKAGFQYVDITAGVDLSSSVFVRENSSAGNVVSLDAGAAMGNTVSYAVNIDGTGKQNVKFELCQRNGSTVTIKDSVTVTFKITCSHSWGSAVVTREPTATREGERTYTCRMCRSTKTEKIPAGGRSLSNCTVTVASAGSYDGRAKTPAVTVRDGSSVLAQGTDYTLTYSDNVNAGTAKVTVTGKNGYTGTKSATFSIAKASQSMTARLPTYTITVGETAKVQYMASGPGDVGYSSSNANVATVDGSGNVTAKGPGTMTIVVTKAATTNYESASDKFSITVVARAVTAGISASASSVSLSVGETKTIWLTATGDLPSRYYYNVQYKGSLYDVEFGSRQGNKCPLAIIGISAGSHVMTASLRDSTSDETLASTQVVVTVASAKSLSNCTVTVASAGSYDGRAKTPAVTVRDGSSVLAQGTDYTLTYSDNVNAGTAKVTVTGKNGYTGTKSATFSIAKASQSVSATLSATRIDVGKTAQISAAGHGPIGYSSSNDQVATVDDAGRVVGKSAGTATIYVSAAGNANYREGETTVTILVKEATKPASAPTLSASAKSVTVTAGRTAEVAFSVSGTLPGECSLVLSEKGSGFTADWRSGGGHVVVVRGIKRGSGSFTVKLVLKSTGRTLASKTVSVTAIAAAKLTSSTSSIKIRRGRAKTIKLTAGGSLPSEYYLSVSNCGWCKTNWKGGWVGSSHRLKIKGLRRGRCTLGVRLVDGRTDQTIATKSIRVRVM